MLRRSLYPTLALCAAVGLALVAVPQRAQAGCGCDHPAPAVTPVMPSFASPGKTVRVHTPDGSLFQPGEQYVIGFGSNGNLATVTVTAPVIMVKRQTLQFPFLDFVMPPGVRSGPVQIEVTGPGISLSYADNYFTAMQPLLVIPGVDGAYKANQVEAAVTADHTLLLPLNVRHLKQGTQLAFQLSDLPFDFNPDDVVFYNADGVDLTLFTLAVDGQTEMQWGSYFGWEVEDDTGLYGAVYDTKVQRSSEPDKTSDVLTYWRHEFQTYIDAHLPGGSHEDDADGFHPDGTLHINHGHLVLAISGLRRAANDPTNPATMFPLSPGRVFVDVEVLVTQSDVPIEPDMMASALEEVTSFGPFAPAESHFDEFEGMDGDSGSGSGSGKGGKK